MTDLGTDLGTDTFRALGAGDAIPENLIVPFYLEDRKLRISVARVGGRLYAFDDLCVCAEPACPLSGGLLEGTTLMCQCHGSKFEVTTGAVLQGPATEALSTYEVLEQDGEVQVRA